LEYEKLQVLEKIQRIKEIENPSNRMEPHNHNDNIPGGWKAKMPPVWLEGAPQTNKYPGK
jgi:hypothetical protein